MEGICLGGIPTFWRHSLYSKIKATEILHYVEKVAAPLPKQPVWLTAVCSTPLLYFTEIEYRQCSVSRVWRQVHVCGTH